MTKDSDYWRRRARGLVGAKLYHALQDPPTWQAELFSRYGFCLVRRISGGFIALLFLAKHFKIPTLEFMDLCSPAAAVGYAIGRIGCLLSVTVTTAGPHSWPMAVGMAFPHGVVPTTETCVQWAGRPTAAFTPLPFMNFSFDNHRPRSCGTWEESSRWRAAHGEIFCSYLILTGAARFLIDSFASTRDRSSVFPMRKRKSSIDVWVPSCSGESESRLDRQDLGLGDSGNESTSFVSHFLPLPR